MTKPHKENLAVITACIMLSFGMVLTAIGFFIEPTGEIHDSVLWVLGQSLIYTGSIFGLATYTKGVVDKRIGEWKDEVRRAKEQSEEPEEKEA